MRGAPRRAVWSSRLSNQLRESHGCEAMKMTRWILLCAFAGFSAFGCTSASPAGGSGSASGASASSGGGGTGSGSIANSGGASPSSGAGSGGTGGSGTSLGSGSGSSTDGGVSVNADASAITDPDIAYTVTLTMDTFTVDPGKEVYMCQDFANPFKGAQVDIKTYELHMAQGSHHMFAFYTPNATDAHVVPCPKGGLQFQPFTFTAQTANAVMTYPQGVGATIPPTQGFTLNVHYINPGTTPITGHVTLTVHVAKPGIITQHAGVLFLNQTLLSVPPSGQPSTSTSSFTLPQDVNVLFTSSHMHQRATDFTATTSAGQTLFQTAQWAEPPPKQYAPALQLKSGTKITWSCTYVNTTGQLLTFGESAATNVMCISVSIFYPVQDINNPVISQLF
jgi:hypothetical protein